MLQILGLITSPLTKAIGYGILIFGIIAANNIYWYNKGANHVQAKWDAALQAQIQKGDKARKDAEKYVSEHPSGDKPRFMRKPSPDPYNRDGH